MKNVVFSLRKLVEIQARMHELKWILGWSK